MSIPKDKPVLDVNNMMTAVDKLCSVSLPIVDSITVDPDRVEGIRSYLNESVLTKGNEMTVGDAGMFAGVTIRSKQVTADQRTPQDIVTQGLAFFMAKDDQQRDDNGKLDPQSNGRRWDTFKRLFGLDISELDHIRSDAGVGFIAPKVTSQTSQSAPDTAQRKAEKRKQATSQRPQVMPKIGAASPQSQSHGVADRADLIAQSAPAEPITEGLNDVHVFTPLGLDDILNTPPLDFLTDNLIVRHSHNVFFAPAKTGKTYLCLHYAVCMVLGIPFVGMENHLQRNLGYINLDMDRRGFIDRLKQVLKGIKPNSTPDDITYVLSRLRIIDRETIRSCHGHTPNFFKAEYLNDLQLFIVTNDIEFCFIDTFSHVRSGSAENSNDDMALTLQNVESFFSPLECGSLVIHHTGKDGLDARGATALKDNTDLVFGLRKVQNSNTHLQLYTKDPRYISPFELDVYVNIAQITNEETGASKADSYLLTTTDPDLDKSVIIDYLKSIGNVPTSRRNIALGATGRYEDNCKAVDTLHLQGILDRVPSGNGRGYRYWIKNIQ